jgi:hypothetical protein
MNIDSAAVEDPLSRSCTVIKLVWLRGLQFQLVAQALRRDGRDPFGQGWQWAPSLTLSTRQPS